MLPQGCDLAAPADKPYSHDKKNLPRVAGLCKLLLKSKLGYKERNIAYSNFPSLCFLVLFDV